MVGISVTLEILTKGFDMVEIRMAIVELGSCWIRQNISPHRVYSENDSFKRSMRDR